MKESELPTTTEIGVYWYIDEETKKVVFDEDSMREEFDGKLEYLKETYGVKID